MARKRKPIFGFGINNVDELTKKPSPKYYETWRTMLKRCYSLKLHKARPSYINCSVSKEWIYLSNFREWFNENYVEGYQLDKDLLFPGNKVYGPDTCLFIPQNINSLFTFCNSNRGEYPLGVHKNRYSLTSRCSNGKGKGIVKCFKDPTEGHLWYLEQKINVIDQYLQEDHSDKIKTGLRRWKQILTYHLDNKIIFDPENINVNLEV